MAVLFAFYQILYKTYEKKEAFTLHAQKIKPIRKDSDGNDVKNGYESCRDFALLDMDESPESLPNFDNMSEFELSLTQYGTVRSFSLKK